jgi:hypothetical protein
MYESIEELREVLEEENPMAIFFDGLDDCIVGLAGQHSKKPLVVYDRVLMVKHFIAEGMSDEEAEEWVSFNIDCLWAGEGTPLILSGVLRE